VAGANKKWQKQTKGSMGQRLFKILTAELLCLFSFLTQTYNGVLQAANQ
jgi:hypothetical protein